MRAILEFDLPEDQADYDRARLGSDAVSALWDIYNRCRAMRKWAQNPSEDAIALGAEIEAMIPPEVLEA